MFHKIKQYVGQSGTEYLILFSAILLITLALISLIFYFPSTSSEIVMSENSAYWSSASPFSVVEAFQSSSGLGNTLILSVHNRDPEYITLDNVTLSHPSSPTAATNTTSQFFKPGEGKIISISNTPFNCTNKEGTVISYNLTFTYSKDTLGGKIQTGLKPLMVKCN